MMPNPIYMLILGLAVTATGYRISSSCVDLCKVEPTIICAGACDIEAPIITSLRSIYGRDVIDTCVTPCICDKDEHVYRTDKICKIIQSFAVTNAGKGCQCKKGANVWIDNLAKWKIEEPAKFARKEVIDYLAKREGVPRMQRRVLAAESETNPWENWCKHKCAEGLGGSACYCDIIP